LRDEWGYDGLVVSDWFMSVKSTAPSVNAGLDLEMPGPGVWRGEKLLQAVEQGEVSEATIDESVRRLLRLLVKAGVFEHPEEVEEQAINRPEQQALAREAAAEGIVLLKNESNVLPLQQEKLSSIAVIGPNAKVARIMAGGSAQVSAHYAITPYEGIAAKVGDRVHIGYELGCTNHKLLPPLDGGQLLAGMDGDKHGWQSEFFNTSDLSGSPVYTQLSATSEFMWLSLPSDAIDPRNFSMRSSTRFIPAETGTYTFSLVSAGLSRLFIDGQLLIDNWTKQTPGEAFFGMASS